MFLVLWHCSSQRVDRVLWFICLGTVSTRRGIHDPWFWNNFFFHSTCFFLSPQLPVILQILAKDHSAFYFIFYNNFTQFYLLPLIEASVNSSWNSSTYKRSNSFWLKCWNLCCECKILCTDPITRDLFIRNWIFATSKQRLHTRSIQS